MCCAADGTVELLIGTQSTGQGHETAYAQIVADDLGVAFEAVRVRQGDTDAIPFGMGTSGSRSLPVGGPAVKAACAALIAQGETLARHLLQAGDQPLPFADGRFSLNGDDGRGITLAGIAAALAAPENRPSGQQAQLTASGRYRLQASTFPNGTHVCEVEVDPETGLTEVVAYQVVDDFGTVVNPLLLAGQVYGGIAQGIGQALFENAVYDPELGAASHRLVRRLRPAAGSRRPVHRLPHQLRPLRHQPDGDQGRRRGRHHRRLSGGGQRRARCPGTARRHRC